MDITEYKERKKAYAKKYYAKQDKKDLAKNRILFNQYGLTLLEYRDRLKEQKNECKVCRRPIKEGTAYIDHCHKTGKVRGILCNHCNLAIGHLQENIEIVKLLVGYLEHA